MNDTIESHVLNVSWPDSTSAFLHTTHLLHIFLYALATTTMIANVMFNVTILFNAKLRTCSNYLLVSNGAADLLVGVCLLPCVGIDWVSASNHSLTHDSCLIWFVTNNYVYAVSIAHMTTISIERFLRVFRTTFHTRWVRRLTLPIAMACWLAPTLTTYVRVLLPIIRNGHHGTNITNGMCPAVFELQESCIFCTNRESTIYGVVLEFFVPMLLSLGCYVAIVLAALRRIRAAERLRRHILQEAETSDGSIHVSSWKVVFGPVERLVTSPEYRSIRLYSAILFVFIVCWTPHSVNRLFLALTGNGFPDLLSGLHEQLVRGYQPPLGYYIWSSYNFRCMTNLLGSANSLVNPLLLFYLSPSFRSGLMVVKDRYCVWVRWKDFRSSSVVLIEPLDSRWNELAHEFSQKCYETDA